MMIFLKYRLAGTVGQAVLAVAGAMLMGACATGGGEAVERADGETGAMRKAAELAGKARNFSLAELRPAKVDVVEVREEDLRKLPTGEERATAYLRSPGRFAGFFGRVDFQEPDLPEGGLPMNGLLLPSID